MGSLFVVRHGQASFGSANYDQLSELGGEQSERLGAFFAERNTRFDAIYTGPAVRHRQTAEGIVRGASTLDPPETKLAEGLDELPAFELFRMHNKQSLHSEAPGADAPTPLKTFETICTAWMHGTLDSGALETAEQFESRVASALRTICQTEGRGKSILVVTSGGPTMIAMKTALRLETGVACSLLWSIANSSVTEFRYREDEISLVAFNRIAHLQAHHVTIR